MTDKRSKNEFLKEDSHYLRGTIRRRAVACGDRRHRRGRYAAAEVSRLLHAGRP